MKIIALILVLVLLLGGLIGCSSQDPLREDMYFGDPVNHAYFIDGRMGMTGTARVINGLWIDAGGIKAPGDKPATEVAHGVLETPAWRFADQAVVANQETISFSYRFAYRMDKTVAPSIGIGWSTTTVDPGDESENVTWQLEYLFSSLGENTAGGPQGTVVLTATASTVAEGLVLSTFTGLDLTSATDFCIHCKVTRLSADASDTVADDVEVHGVCLLFTSNRLGGP